MERVLILGATSAIAAEVAVLHARRGDRLHLVGRSPAKLAAVVARCAGAAVTSATADFTDAGAPDAGVLRSYTVVMYLEGPRALDVFESRDKAAAMALAEKITAALALPAPRTHDRRPTMLIPDGAAVALGAVWVFAAMVAGIASTGVRGPAAGVSDWLTIAAWVAPYVLLLAVPAHALVRRSLAPVSRSEPHTPR